MKIFTSIKNKEATMLGSFKNYAGAVSRALLALTLALAFFASDALAQCGGKKIYIQLPDGWGNTIYIQWEGAFRAMTGVTKDGKWTIFTLPTGLQNDNASKAEIFFTDFNATYNASGIHFVGKDSIGSHTNVPSGNKDKFTCSDFGPDGTYIMENPDRPGRTYFRTTPPDAYYFYFLPPSDDEWILGTPYLMYDIGEGRKEKIKLETDPTRCGWYTKMWFNEPLPSGDAWIYLEGGENYNKLGLRGFEEDPLDWPTGPDGDPTPFKLPEQYGNKPGNLFFAPSAESIWRPTDPGTKGICSYKFAAYIYQRTSFSNTGGFSWWVENSDERQFGICKGLVKPVLDDKGKMQWANGSCASPYGGVALGGWENGTNFENAFKETSGQNKKYCYNMPFTQRPGGLWEFDAYYLCKNGTETDYNSTYNSGCGAGMGGTGSVGGFYNMKSSDTPPVALGARTNYDGDRVGVVKDYQWCFDRGWSGNGTGDLSKATTATEINNVMTKACTARYPTSATINGSLSEQTEAHCPWYGKADFSTALQTACPFSEASQPKGVSGGHLCFESQDAEFTYSPGQEFFFRGDDDIWVFVSNQLAIDLGGNHMPAPGYIKMDTLKVSAAAQTVSKLSVPSREYKSDGGLVEGKKYPIKIFFCDRRGPGSNVRISTNMYFSQKSGLSLKEGSEKTYGDVCLKTSGGGTCGSGGDKEDCGPELNGKLRYYIQRRDGTGRINLDKNNTNCVSQNDGSLLCYGSIKIHLSNGKVGITAANTTGLLGTWRVWAEVTDVAANVPPLPLGTVSGRTFIYAVWGTVQDENGKNITSIPTIPSKSMGGGKMGLEAVASKCVRVGFADGQWIDSTGSSPIFAVSEGSAGQTVRLQPSSAKDPDVPGSNLRVFRGDACTDDQEASFNDDFKIPSNGLLELWFTGDFAVPGTATYEIDSRASGFPFVLKVYQPKLEFVNEANEIIPQAQRWGSDPTKPGTTPADRSVYISTTLSRKIAAYDPTVSPMTICTTCNFEMRDVKTETSVDYQGNSTRDNSVIEFSDKRIENGIGRLEFSGAIAVEHDSTASFTVGGPSPDPSTLARWEKLQFREPPIPFPTFSAIFDRNGDGKGDSIIVVYNRMFPRTGGIPDSLPNKLQIIWAPGDTAFFGLANLDGNGKYTNAGITASANWEYWEKYFKEGKCSDPKACGDTISIAISYDAGSKQFSEGIKTAARGGENVFSWSTFVDDNGNTGVTQKFDRKITDRIPPIIVKAEYQADDDSKCGDPSRRCRDRVFIEVSEKIKTVEGKSAEDARKAFAYILMAGDPDVFKVYDEAKSLATSIAWGRKQNFPDGDSSVTLTYLQYKTDEDNSLTPVPNDSVRFLAGHRDRSSDNPESHAFVDLEGNFPNPAEIGRRIEGRGRFNTDRILIANADPNDKNLDAIRKKMEERFGNGSGFFNKIKDLFPVERPIEFLPVPENCQNKIKECMESYYPGTVGTIFWPGVKSTLSDPKYASARAEDIYFIANSFYHTNLGNFVVKSNEVKIRCDDPVFQIDGQGDCKSNNGLYLAWDLRDNKGRTVGTGAYVQVYNFRWEVKNNLGKVEAPNKYPSDGNKIEMFGVKRTKGSQR